MRIAVQIVHLLLLPFQLQRADAIRTVSQGTRPAVCATCWTSSCSCPATLCSSEAAAGQTFVTSPSPITASHFSRLPALFLLPQLLPPHPPPVRSAVRPLAANKGVAPPEGGDPGLLYAGVTQKLWALPDTVVVRASTPCRRPHVATLPPPPPRGAVPIASPH